MAVFGKRTQPVAPVENQKNPSAETEQALSNIPPVHSGEEKRVSRRKRTLKAGTIAYNDHHFTAPCMVRDMSDTGARIKFDESAIVPETFVLEIELDAINVGCEVVWRRINEVGVKFTSDIHETKKVRVQVVSSADPPNCHPLKRS